MDRIRVPPVPATRLHRWERLFLLSVSGFVLASRIPFATQMPCHWDSVQFVLGMAHFDVTQHQPHPPGYVLYVLLGRTLQFLVPEAHGALVLLSILSGAVAVPLVYLLARSLYHSTAAVGAVLFFATSPVVWFSGEMALSDIVEGMVVALVGLLCWQARTGSKRHVLLSAVALGMGGGIRPQSLLLVPLWFYSAFVHGGVRVAVGALVGVACVASWLLPMAVLSGGWPAYWRACWEVWHGSHGAAIVGRVGPTLLWENVALVVVFCLQGLSLALAPLLIQALRHARSKSVVVGPRNPSGPFLAVWILPVLFFYALARVVRPGILMTVLPALFVWAGSAASGELMGSQRADTSRQKIQGARMRWVGVVGVVALLNSVLFLGLRGPLSAWGLRRLQEDLKGRVEAVRRVCPPQTTVILTHGQHFYKGFRLAAYYLPEYRVMETGWLHRPPWVLGYRGQVTFSDQPNLPQRLERVVLFDYDEPDDLPLALRAHFPHYERADLPLPSGERLICYRRRERF